LHQAVNGEIASLRVECWICFEPDLIRVPAVGVCAFAAKGRNFHLHSTRTTDQYDAEMGAYGL
jgi:hypothetical protein